MKSIMSREYLLLLADEAGGLYVLMIMSFFPLYYWVFKAESFDEELKDFNFICHRPERLEILQGETKFSKSELRFLYRGFKNECPSGFVNEAIFKHIYSQFFPQGDSSVYAQFLFEAFDTNRNGCLSFQEFVTGLSLILRGSMYDRLYWAFNFYDVDRDGFITKQEMLKVMRAIYKMMGKFVSPCVHEDTPREHVENFFQKMDRNRDGVITIEEFMESCEMDENIMRSMRLFDSVF